MKQRIGNPFRLALLAASLVAGAAQAQTTLIFNSALSDRDPARQVAVVDFAERIAAESGGSITVTIPDATLASSGQQYEMLLDGVADMAFISTPDIAQLVATTGLAELPGMAPSSEAASVALWKMYDSHFRALDEYRELVVLSTHVLPGRHLMGVGAPVNTADAVRGLKVWTPNGPLVQIPEALGAVPITVPFPQLFEVVSRNQVDALVAAPGTAVGARIAENLHHLTKIPGGVGSVSIAVVMRREAWDGLNADQQAAVLRAADGLPQRTGAAIDERENGAMRAFPDLTVTPPDAGMLEIIATVAKAQTAAWIEAARANGLADPEAALAEYSALLAEMPAK